MGPSLLLKCVRALWDYERHICKVDYFCYAYRIIGSRLGLERSVHKLGRHLRLLFDTRMQFLSFHQSECAPSGRTIRMLQFIRHIIEVLLWTQSRAGSAS